MRLSGKIIGASVAQWIEHLASDQGVAGSTPVRRAGPLAQLAEHLPLKETVTGSTPVRLTFQKKPACLLIKTSSGLQK